MTAWRFGCDAAYTISIPRGYGYREVTVRCGSTAMDGGVNQCDACAVDPKRRPPPTPEYGDDYDDGE